MITVNQTWPTVADMASRHGQQTWPACHLTAYRLHVAFILRHGEVYIRYIHIAYTMSGDPITNSIVTEE